MGKCGGHQQRGGGARRRGRRGASGTGASNTGAAQATEVFRPPDGRKSLLQFQRSASPIHLLGAKMAGRPPRKRCFQALAVHVGHGAAGAGGQLLPERIVHHSHQQDLVLGADDVLGRPLERVGCGGQGQGQGLGEKPFLRAPQPSSEAGFPLGRRTLVPAVCARVTAAKEACCARRGPPARWHGPCPSTGTPQLPLPRRRCPANPGELLATLQPPGSAPSTWSTQV